MNSRFNPPFRAVLAVLAGICLSAQAQNSVTWIGPAAGGEWNVAANWSANRVPGAGTNAVIGPGTNVNYNLPMAAPAFGILTNRGTLNINTSGFNNTGILMLNPGGTGKVSVNAGGGVNVAGNFAFCSNSIATLAAGSAVNIAGSLLIGCGATGGTTGSTPGSYGTMTNDGGDLAALSTSLNPGNGSVSKSALLVINGGNNNLGNVIIKRSSGTANFTATGTDGLAIYSGTVTMSNLNVGGPGGNSYLSALIAGGVVTNFGNVSINQLTSGRGSRLLQTGGLFVVPDPAVINPNPTASGSLNIFSVTGGTNITGGLYFGNGANGGIINFTNSSVIYVGSQGIASNGAATLNVVLNDGGSFGATADWTGSAAMNLSGGTFIFNPTAPNGDPHTITVTGMLSGDGGLLVTNGGTLVLAADNGYAGNTTVAGGSLVLGNSGSLPAGSSLTIGSAGTDAVVDLAGFSPQLGALAAAGIDSNQLITNSSTVSAATLIFSNGAADSTFGGRVAGGTQPIALCILAGHLTLSGLNNYAGTISIDDGTLSLSGPGSVFTGPEIILSNSTSTLDLTGMNILALASGQTLGGYGSVTGTVSCDGSRIAPGFDGLGGALTIDGDLSLAGNATNQFDLLFDPNAPGNDQILVSGTLSLSGLNTIRINPINNTLSPGPYHLIHCASVGAGNSGNFQVVTPPGFGLQASVSVTATGVDLIVSQSAEELDWTGDGAANLWDLASTNWLDAGLPAVFTNGAFVVFDDSSTNHEINLTGVLQPAFVAVDAASSYTLAGAGKISGTVTLTKTNSGALISLTTNGFNGAVTISQGTVQLGNGVAAGSLGTAVIVDNSRLLLRQPGDGIFSNAISGS